MATFRLRQASGGSTLRGGDSLGPPVDSSITAALRKVQASLNAGVAISTEVDATLDEVSSAISVSTIDAAIDSDLRKLTASLNAIMQPQATVSVVLRKVQSQIRLRQTGTAPTPELAMPRVFIRSSWPPFHVIAELTTAHNIDPAELQMEPGAAVFNVFDDDPQLSRDVLRAGNVVTIEMPYFEPWAGVLITAEDSERAGVLELTCLGRLAALDGRTVPQELRFAHPLGAGTIVRNLADIANRVYTGIDVALNLDGPSIESLAVGGQSTLEAFEEIHTRTGSEFWTRNVATRKRLTTTLYFDEQQGQDVSDELHLYAGVHFAETRHKQDASQVRQSVTVIGDYGPELGDRMSVTRSSLLTGAAKEIAARALEVSTFLSASSVADLPPGLYNERLSFEVLAQDRAEVSRRAQRSQERPLRAQETFQDEIALPALSPSQTRRLRIGNVYTRHGRFRGEYTARKVRIKALHPDHERGRCEVQSEAVLT